MEDQPKADHEAVTVLARARERKLRLSQGQLSEAGRRTAAIYRKVYDAEPQATPEIVTPAPLSKPELTIPMSVFAYRRPDVPMIDAAIDSVMNGTPAPVPVKRKRQARSSGPQDPALWERWKHDVLLVLALGKIVERPKTTEWLIRFSASVRDWVRKMNRALTSKQRAVIEHTIREHMWKHEWDAVVVVWASEFDETLAAVQEVDEAAEF